MIFLGDLDVVDGCSVCCVSMVNSSMLLFVVSVIIKLLCMFFVLMFCLDSVVFSVMLMFNLVSSQVMFLVRCDLGMCCLISDIVMIIVGVKNILVSSIVRVSIGRLLIYSSGIVVSVVVVVLVSNRCGSGICSVCVLNSRFVVQLFNVQVDSIVLVVSGCFCCLVKVMLVMLIVLMIIFIVSINSVSRWIFGCCSSDCMGVMFLWGCSGGLVLCCRISVIILSISSRVVVRMFVCGYMVIDSFIDNGGLVMKVILLNIVFSEYVVCSSGWL